MITTDSPATILLIDDEESLLESMADYLEDRDYQILRAENGRVGIEVFDRHRPDLVFTDLRMPELGGLDVLRHITEISPETPLLVVSGTGRISDSVEALRLGAWDFLLKPIEDLSIVSHAIESALERARLRRENRSYQKSIEEQLHQARKMEVVGLLVGGVVHDFNNMLCAISGNAELLLADLSAEDPQLESIEQILDATQRAANLTQQLLAFSRKQVIVPKTLNLSHLIMGLHAMMARLIGDDIVLKTIPQKRIGLVRIDPSQIEQIVLNLAINARDAMPDGGDLVIETANVELDADFCAGYTAAIPGSYVMLMASDTGIGMDAETQACAFEPFFTTKEPGRGTGLGLATVLDIVERYGGAVEISSEVDDGSVFRVYFPRVTAEVEPHSPTEVSSVPKGGTETVLLVENDDNMRYLARKILRHLGYQVLTADSGDAALTLVEHYDGSIDLLLSDVVMPQMNGRTLAAKLSEQHPGLRVLFTSGYPHDVIACHGMFDEGVCFIGKPYSVKLLASRIRAVLDGTD